MQYWGGAGFVVLPVDSADIHPAVLSALKAYDPDFVAVPPASSGIDVGDRATLHAAQRTVAAACCCYLTPIAEPPDLLSPSTGKLASPYLSGNGMAPATPINDLIDESATVPASANAEIGGALGLSTAMRWGIAEWPRDAVADTGEIDRIKLRSAIWRIASYSRDTAGLDPIINQEQSSGEFATIFDRTLYGLMPVYEFGEDRPPMLVVWGDAPSDFALSMAWDRTYGYAVWIPDEWWNDTDLRDMISEAIGSFARNAVNQYRPVVFTSTSVGHEELQHRLSECRSGLLGLSSLAAELSEAPTAALASQLRFPKFNKSHYAIRGRFADEWSTTVYEDQGTLSLAMLPPVPMVGASDLANIDARAHWHVDISIRSHTIPVTAPIPQECLLADGRHDKFYTLVRSSRSGLSFTSHRLTFIPGEAVVEQRLARPLLRFPSLFDWAQCRAEMHSLSVRLSAAGAQAKSIASLVGGRSDLTKLLAGPLLPGLQAFNRTGASVDAFPIGDGFAKGDGCVINREAFMTFTGFCHAANLDAGPDARDTVDQLVHGGLLRRGLILQCSTCEHLAFIPVDTVSTVNLCPRCNGTTRLERRSWHWPDSEPSWFYDLHRTARSLLKSNGHVPLALAELLGRDTRGYSDAPEFELVNRDQTPLVETDLLALTGRELILAEAKSTTSLGRGKELRSAARKRVYAARVFAADQIVLATPEDRWEDSTLNALISAVDSESWPSGQPPRLRIITRLGQSDVATRHILVPAR